jgi:(E)-4-hydroxy-3-methylbut-2-enyl-diphosphate synthase
MPNKTPIVKIGSVKIGGSHPIAIQSMTNTDTADAAKTAKQCMELADAGSELVRITVNNEAAAASVPEIRKILNKKGYKHLPLIGDFHFNAHELLEKFPQCAKTLDKYRINPGNIGHGKNHHENFEKIIKIAIKNKKPIRIGVNFGSLDQALPKNMKPIDAMIKSALDSATYAEKLGLKQNKIVLSVKMSDVQDVIKANQLLAKKMQKHPYALHLGLTEAGSGLQGVTCSSTALSILLQQGIGDTIRISLTPKKGESRTKEVQACKFLLQSLGLRQFQPKITSCPGCGRTDNKLFQKIVSEISAHIEKNLAKSQKSNPKINKLKIAIMGCIVNGPGESRHADIALHLPGKAEQKSASVYVKGKFFKTLKGKNISQQFIKILKKEFL